MHAVQYPGREDRFDEPPVADMATLARLAAAELAGLAGPADRPLALFGHSMGAAVAYEVARLLPRPPAHLFVSGRHAPSEVVPGDVHLRDDDGLVVDLTRLGGTSGEVLAMPEMRELLLPVIRNDYRLAETYRELAGGPLGCPVTVLTGTVDPEVTPAQAKGWAAHTTGAFQLAEFAGDHFYLVPQRTAVIDLVTDALIGSPQRT